MFIIIIFLLFCDTYPCTAYVDVYVQKTNVHDWLVPTSSNNFFFTILYLCSKIGLVLVTKQ